MTDRRFDIPFGCMMNVIIVGRVAETQEFRQACIDVPSEMGMTRRSSDARPPFFNLSWGAYMMYCLIVVPRELCALDASDPFYVHLKTVNVMRGFRVLRERRSFADDPCYHWCCLRNSISHVNYSIGDNDLVKLWDHRPRKPEPRYWHWEVEITHEHMRVFLTEILEPVMTAMKRAKAAATAKP